MHRFSKGGEYHSAIKKAWGFFNKHVNAETEEDWASIARELKIFTTSFEVHMSVAIVQEIQRNCRIKEYGAEFEAELLKLEQKFDSDVCKLMEVYNGL